MADSTRTVLVIGATGKVGRHVVAGLLEQGADVRALSRKPGSWPGGMAGPRLDVVAADLADPAAVAGAAEGTHAVFLLWPGFSAQGAEPVVKTLAEDGRHVVHLSAAELQGDIGAARPGVWLDVEDLVRESADSWTFLRAGGFAANTLAWADRIRAGQPVAVPAPLARRSLVHERDLADVAVTTLLDPGTHAGRAYALTGPESLSQVEQLETIAAAAGVPVAWSEQSPQDAVQEFSRFMGAELAASSVRYWQSLVTAPEVVTSDVERVTGRPARTFAQWAQDHAGDFRPASGPGPEGQPR